ncbi:hypothetical protein NDU88_007096 [Pleurodeles waltl]|uniref:Uncharacterized protein n=1 Tax=Pleurodeles waltl TaxID=8319 RepID=A0AAV7N2H1_PLEWA|nr:hypothetical protein NDU88_007096 [Pleurodeles waltl]
MICWRAVCAAHLPIVRCLCRTPTARGVSPTDDGGPHDLPGWAPQGLTYLRCTLELIVGPCPEGPELLGCISRDSETRVTASYPQRATPIRQPILPFTDVPCFGSLHIVLTAHVPQTPGGIFICMCTQRGDGLLHRGEQNCWKRPDCYPPRNFATPLGFGGAWRLPVAPTLPALVVAPQIHGTPHRCIRSLLCSPQCSTPSPAVFLFGRQ